MLAAFGPGHLECCSSTFPGLEAGSLEVTSNVLQTFPVHLQVTIETPEWEKHLEISLSKTQRADPARDCARMFRFEDQRTDCTVPLVHQNCSATSNLGFFSLFQISAAKGAHNLSVLEGPTIKPGFILSGKMSLFGIETTGAVSLLPEEVFKSA